MFSRRHCPLLLALLPIIAACSAPRPTSQLTVRDSLSSDATRLPTGVHLDPAGMTHPVGPLPLAIAVAPGGTRVALLLNGWSRVGVQIVDWRQGRTTQTIDLPAAFLGLAFSPDGKWLCASGGNTDQIYRFRWTGDSAILTDSVALAERQGRRAGVRYPAQIAFSRDGRQLFVTENLADSLAVIEMSSGAITHRVAAGRYPYGIVVGNDGTVYVSAWGGGSVATFSDANGWLTPTGSIPAGRHPSALLLNRSGTRLFVASASTDRVSVIDTRSRQRIAELRDPPPAGPDEGSTPNALSLSSDESRLFVAEADANAVAVFDLSSATADHQTSGADRLAGRVPTGWYPAAVATIDTSLVIANGKGLGTHANRDGPGPRMSLEHQGSGKNGTLGQLTGTLSVVNAARLTPTALDALSKRVAGANGWNATGPAKHFPPFEHVIYVIRENRTYDQVLGDLSWADGDTSLVYFGRDVTPNAHAIATRFGGFDRFFVNAEVSADGHNWTTAAYASDYVEKTVQPNYSGRGRTYDYEGTNRGVIPEDDVNEPATGYLWTLAAKNGVSLRNYGEFVVPDRSAGSEVRFVGNKPELKSNTNPQFPGFNLDIPDQKRADIWLAELQTYVQRGSMPALEIVRLPNDHTSGGSAGKPTPRAAAADNDLALGRMIAALSRTPFWKSTVVFVLEDDAQNGPDHVDSHRSPLLVISPYNRSGAFHRFTNTTDVIRTIEGILNLGSMSQFDYFGRPLTDVWSAEPDVRPYDVITPAVPLDERNPRVSRGALESLRLRLDAEDESDDDDFSRILWHVVKGYGAPYPGPTRMSLLEAKRGR
ncbi:MAG TPA: beta-propeller fold lactonase family protein [Gemmatimonadaceae bacterium]|nr:beta-propeller fold lactonase family protein [Gemmatimonadaceae bacterium]